jgi:hypothetical protein
VKEDVRVRWWLVAREKALMEFEKSRVELGK